VLRFGYDANGNVSNPHDVLVENVTVHQTAGHGILLGISPVKTLIRSLCIRRARDMRSGTVRYPDRSILISHGHSGVPLSNFTMFGTDWPKTATYTITAEKVLTWTSVNRLSYKAIRCTITYANICIRQRYWNPYSQKSHTQRLPDGTRSAAWYRGIHKSDYRPLHKGCGHPQQYYTEYYDRYQYLAGYLQFSPAGDLFSVDIRHNTITGQRGQKAAIGLSYETLFGDPAPNVVFSGLRIHGNILSAHPDSLNNGRLLTAPLNPQPGLQASYNMWNLPPGPGFNQTTDQSQPLLPDLGSSADTVSFLPGLDDPAFIV
jgi:hypothetical protein